MTLLSHAAAVGAAPRVLFATPQFSPGTHDSALGAVSAQLCRALHRSGCDIKILVPSYPAVRAAVLQPQRVASIPAQWGYPRSEVLLGQWPGGPDVLLLDCPQLYGRYSGEYGGPHRGCDASEPAGNALRFGLLSWAAAYLASGESPLAWHPDVLHCNDWPCGLAPAYLKSGLSAPAATLMTVHQLASLGVFAPDCGPSIGLLPGSLITEGALHYGGLSMLKAGLFWADRISTVSPTYAQEIQNESHGLGLHALLAERADVLMGVLNGIDTDVWDPARDPHIALRYQAPSLALKRINQIALRARVGLPARQRCVLLGMVGHLSEHKGVDLLLDALPDLLGRSVQIVILGQGEPRFERALQQWARAVPSRMAVSIGYDAALAHHIQAGADALLVPSRREPCGLNQMISQRYGTPPIIQDAGGLADSVCPYAPPDAHALHATGFSFTEATPSALVRAVDQALEVFDNEAAWLRICANGMQRDFSWAGRSRAYQAMYADVFDSAQMSPPSRVFQCGV